MAVNEKSDAGAGVRTAISAEYWETRSVQVYALTVAKGGLRLPTAKVACFAQTADSGPPPRSQGPRPPLCGYGLRTRDGIKIEGASMAEFCRTMSTRIPLFFSPRQLIDKTGVAGQFDFVLKFPPEDSRSHLINTLPSGLMVIELECLPARLESTPRSLG